MEIEYGAEVIDTNGKVLGTIDYVIRDTWTGEVRKFTVRPKASEREQAQQPRHLFLSPQNIIEETESKIRVNVTLDELSENG